MLTRVSSLPYGLPFMMSGLTIESIYRCRNNYTVSVVGNLIKSNFHLIGPNVSGKLSSYLTSKVY